MSDDFDPSARDAEKDALAQLEGLSLAELLAKGQENLVRGMVAKSMAGTISHQEAAILRNLLRDNGMTMGLPPMKTIEHQAPKALPVFDRPDYEDA